MRYLISDIHGCYEEYRKLLDQIRFSDKDRLYVLGDAMDRGPQPIKVMQDIMARPNITYIIGNHDYEFFYFAKKLSARSAGKDAMNDMSEEELYALAGWLQDGGSITLRQFSELSVKDGGAILEYLADASAYEVLEEGGKEYILVHAGIDNFREDRELEEYDFLDFISSRPDYTRRYYQREEVFVVTGHTPTPLIREDELPLVYQKNGHIAIDCGCVFGGRLAAYCIESGKITYVTGENREKTEV